MTRKSNDFASRKIYGLLAVIGRCSQVCRRFSVYDRAKQYEADGYARDVTLAKAMKDYGLGLFIRLAR